MKSSSKSSKASAKFWDRAAEKYARDPISDEASYQKKLQITQKYFQPQMQILEFGCGTGSTAIIHAPFVEHILATDVSAEMLKIAQAKVEKASISNISFQQSTIEELEQPKASFDVILGMSILHLLEDPKAAIEKVYTLLKPGGFFISSTMCLSDGMKWLRLIKPLAHFGLLPSVITLFSAEELLSYLKAANFAIETQWCPGKRKAQFIVAKKPAQLSG